MAERSLLDQILLDEVQGKNSAIHAYDRIIWTIRTGFVTLFFAAWGILLTSIAKEESLDPKKITKIVVPLLIVSAGLSVCAWLVDINYVRRKFRVISSLNTGLRKLVDHNVSSKRRASLPAGPLRAFLKVAGDSGDKSYVGAGYNTANHVCTLIYTVPWVTIVISLLVFGHVISYDN